MAVINGHKEHWPCTAKEVKLWLAREFWNKYNKTVNNDAITTALNTLQGIALFEGEKFKLENRIAFHENNIYYSLSNENWESIQVRKDGWEIKNNTPIIFRPYGHQAEQVTPVSGGDVRDIFNYINVSNEEHKVLFIIWLITAFVPEIPQPILYIYGPQGSAKSTVSRLIKTIIDPSQIDVSDIPKEKKELIQQLSHHRCSMFDNVSFLSHSLSDLLCRAVTGMSFSKRQLYSDDSDIIYRLKRCIGINGINLLAVNPDLLERSVLIELERISKDGRRSEQELMNGFEKALPGILGGILDVLAAAMKIEPDVKLTETPRMADFSRWGYAIADALGYSGDTFIKYYTNNMDLQQEEVLENSVEATFIIELMKEKNGHWEGSPTELLDEMTNALFGTRDNEIPKKPQILSRRLNIIKTNLEELGISIEFVSGQNRRIIIRKVTENIAPIAPPSQNTLIDNKNI